MIKNPVNTLLEEHTIIADAIETARTAGVLVGKDDKAYESAMRKLITFFREYGDSYHHFKEETILFPEIAKKREMLGEGIIKEMNENHDDFREKISLVEENLNVGNFVRAQKVMDWYGAALMDHIAAENEELFVAANSLFSTNEMESMYYRSIDCDRDLGNDRKRELIEYVGEIKASINEVAI